MNAETAASGTPVVLLVDDDAVVRFLAREALEEAGFVVVETDNGVSALEMLAEIRPGLVMLDIARSLAERDPELAAAYDL